MIDNDVMKYDDDDFGEELNSQFFAPRDSSSSDKITTASLIEKSSGGTIMLYSTTGKGKTSISDYLATEMLAHKLANVASNGGKLKDPYDNYEFTTSILLSHSFLVAASMITPAFQKLILSQDALLDKITNSSYSKLFVDAQAKGDDPDPLNDPFLKYYKRKIDSELNCIIGGLGALSAKMARIYSAVKMNLLPEFIIPPSVLNSSVLTGQVVTLIAEDTTFGIGSGPVITLDSEVDGTYKFRSTKSRTNPPMYFSGMLNAAAAIIGYYTVFRISAYNEWLIYSGVSRPAALGGSRSGGLSAEFVGSVSKANLKFNAIGSDVIMEVRHDFKDNYTLEALTKTLINLDNDKVRIRDDKDHESKASKHYAKSAQSFFEEINQLN